MSHATCIHVNEDYLATLHLLANVASRYIEGTADRERLVPAVTDWLDAEQAGHDAALACGN